MLTGPTTEYFEVTGFGAVLNAGNSDLNVVGQNIYSMADDSFTFTVVLKSIPEKSYGKTITATPNLTYTMDGVNTTVTGTPIAASVNDLMDVD